MKAWKLPCRLCKVFINSIDFTWEQKRNLEFSVALREVFVLLASIILLQVHPPF